MLIGIIGGPKSGKTELAKHIQKQFPDYKIIDKYVDRLTEDTDTAFGVYASLIGNVQVAIERLNEEQAAKLEKLISCGTLLETIVYTAIHADIEESLGYGHPAQTEIVMSYLGLMMTETFTYDRLFYLPSEDEVFDRQLEYAFRLWGLKPTKVENNDYTGITDELKKYQEAIDELLEAAKAFK